MVTYVRRVIPLSRTLCITLLILASLAFVAGTMHSDSHTLGVHAAPPCDGQLKQIVQKSPPMDWTGVSMTAVLMGSFDSHSGLFCNQYASRILLTTTSDFSSGYFYYQLNTGTDSGPYCSVRADDSNGLLHVTGPGSYDQQTGYHYAGSTDGYGEALSYISSGRLAKTGCVPNYGTRYN